jgi:hypothetical protein
LGLPGALYVQEHALGPGIRAVVSGSADLERSSSLTNTDSLNLQQRFRTAIPWWLCLDFGPRSHALHGAFIFVFSISSSNRCSRENRTSCEVSFASWCFLVPFHAAGMKRNHRESLELPAEFGFVSHFIRSGNPRHHCPPMPATCAVRRALITPPRWPSPETHDPG